MNYTKGEWKITRWKSGYGFNVCGEHFVAAVPMSSTFSFSKIEVETNAQLIAAAPGMYEALKEAKDMFIRVARLNSIIDTDGDYTILMTHIEKALAKAEEGR